MIKTRLSEIIVHKWCYSVSLALLLSQNNISSNDVWSNAYEHDISLNTIGISTNKLENLDEIETGMMDGLRGYERCHGLCRMRAGMKDETKDVGAKAPVWWQN